MIERTKPATQQTQNDLTDQRWFLRTAYLFPGLALGLLCSGCLALAVGAAGAVYCYSLV